MGPLPPGPPPRRGAIASARYYAAFANDPIGFVAQRFERYGDIYHAPGAGPGLYVSRHPEHIREVLTVRAAAFSKEHSAFAVLSRVLGEGLLTSDGATWTRQRRIVQPAFAPRRLEGYAAIMVEEALRTAERWATGGVRDLGAEMNELTLRVVCRALFGTALSSDDVRTIGRAMELLQRSLASDGLVPAWLPTLARRRLAHATRELDALVVGMIEARRSGKRDAERPDLLERLVTEDPTLGSLSTREIRDQLVTLILAGHETTSNALAWTWACLARNADAETKLHAELDAALAGRAPSLGDLQALPYTEQVVSEAMRLYPPVYVIARRAREDTEIGGYLVPRGAEVVLWTYLTQRDARFFPDPLAFRPERFATTADETPGKQAWLPFGAGPRACIGKAFAMNEARLLLATLAQRFVVRLAPGQTLEPRPRITLNPKRRLRAIVTPR